MTVPALILQPNRQCLKGRSFRKEGKGPPSLKEPANLWRKP